MRTAFLVGILCAASAALSQPVVDYSVAIVEGGVPLTGGEVIYALVVTGDWWTDAKEPFVVRLAVPPELAFVSGCSGEPNADLAFDPATRILEWKGRLDNPSIALKSCPITFGVSPSLEPGSTFTMTATLAMKPDPNAANNTAMQTGFVRASSDLEIEGSADIQRFKPGTTVTYTFEVMNRGPQDAHDVVVVDVLSPDVELVSFQQQNGPPATLDASPQFADPSVGCAPPRCGAFLEARIPALSVGSRASFRLAVKTKQSLEAADIHNTVAALSTSVDLFDRNNDRDVVTFAGPDADLRVASRGAPDPHARQVSLTLDASNEGPDTVNSVKVRNVLRTGDGQYGFVYNVKFLSVTPTQGTCSAPILVQPYDHAGTPPYWTLDCALGTLVPGAKATMTVVIDRARVTDAFVHTSSVTPAQNDPNANNNQTQVGVAPVPRRRAVGR